MGAQAADDPDSFAHHPRLDHARTLRRRGLGHGCIAWRYKPTDVEPGVRPEQCDRWRSVHRVGAGSGGQPVATARTTPSPGGPYRARYPGPRPHGRSAYGAAAGLDGASSGRDCLDDQPVLLRVRPVQRTWRRWLPSPHLGHAAAGRRRPSSCRAGMAKWMLPPDWLRVDRARTARSSIAPGWPPRFSWDAIRVPLHVAWGKHPRRAADGLLPPVLGGSSCQHTAGLDRSA